MLCCRSAIRTLSILIIYAAALEGPAAQMSPPVPKPTATPRNTQTDEAGPGSSAAVESHSDEHEQLTVFPHSESSRYWISGQANVVFQWHPLFPAQYSGRNSLTPGAQSATTHVLTLYTGYALTHTTEVFADLEDATGGGIGSAFGLAGYTNLDAVRTAQGIPLSKAPYLARLMLRQIVPLSDEHIEVDRDELHLATSVPARRLEIRFGKFSLADFFDVNTRGSGSHLQFLNWTVDNDGAWDYAANTRGYTDGALVEYDDCWFSARFGEVLEPKVANGIYLDADIARAHAEA
jgi:high affinity Mn2+ porin